MKLELSKIRIDGGTQSRANLQRNIINEYAELMSNDVELPPLDVFHDGENYWLVDGFHRYWAKKQISPNNTEDNFLPEETIEVTVHQGTQRDAILFSLGANNDHGIRRTNDDKNRAVETMIRDSEWQKWSDREIAKICKVSNTFVAKCRERLNDSTVNIDSKTYKRDGKVQTMKIENIGKHKITKEKEVVDTKTGEIVIKNEDTLQLKESIEKEIEETQRELEEQFDQDAEMPISNVISEEIFLKKEFIKGQAEKIAELEKLLDISDKFYKMLEHENNSLKSSLLQVAAIIGFNLDDSNLTWEILENVLDKLKEIMQLNNKVSKITETNNQLFAANENLNQELNKIKEENRILKEDNKNLLFIKSSIEDEVKELKEQNQTSKEVSEYREKHLNNQLSNVRLINEDVLELKKSNQMLKDQVSALAEENNTLKESRDRLKLQIKPLDRDAESMLASLQGIFESCLEKNKEKREGIRIGKSDSIELLNSIKQARGIE
ncbi:MAG: hypothetical protein RIT27_92 [Pseudomonadota bacterium]|jgi:hypothetical protein